MRTAEPHHLTDWPGADPPAFWMCLLPSWYHGTTVAPPKLLIRRKMSIILVESHLLKLRQLNSVQSMGLKECNCYSAQVVKVLILIICDKM